MSASPEVALFQSHFVCSFVILIGFFCLPDAQGIAD